MLQRNERKFRVGKYSGFTLVELLVVIAIIGILIGMLLPAVQMVREAARRTDCSNNIHQISLAITNYESTHLRLPPMADAPDFFPDPSTGRVAGPSWSWQVFILPFLEQQSIYDIIDPTGQTAVDACGHAVQPQGAVLLQAFQTPLFVCPSDDGPLLNEPRFLAPPGSVITDPESMEVAKGNYVAVNRSTNATCFVNLEGQPKNEGVMESINLQVNLNSCRDGTSNTAILGERAWTYNAGGNKYNAFATNQLINRHVMDSYPVLAGGASDTCATAFGGSAINFAHADPLAAQETFSSGHPAGAVFGFMDGSTHFLSQSIDSNVMRQLCDKSDGEIMADFR